MKLDMKKIIHDTTVLFVICVISGLLLGISHEITYPITAARKAQEKAAAFADLYTEAAEFKDDNTEAIANQEEILAAAGISGATINDCLTAYDADGNVIGYGMSITTAGKVGEIVTAFCYDTATGTSKGISILESSETAGLGAKASEPEFTDQFVDKMTDSFSVVKTTASDDSQIEAISGATVTSNAVVLATNAGIAFANYCAANAN